MTKLITFDEAVTRVKAEVDTRPDFVYAPIEGEHGSTCVYFTEDGAPSCLVGVAFAPELTEADVIFRHNEEGIGTLIDADILPATARAREFLETIQVNQDTGSSWSYALEIALAADDFYLTLDDTSLVAA